MPRAARYATSPSSPRRVAPEVAQAERDRRADQATADDDDVEVPGHHRVSPTPAKRRMDGSWSANSVNGDRRRRARTGRRRRRRRRLRDNRVPRRRFPRQQVTLRRVMCGTRSARSSSKCVCVTSNTAQESDRSARRATATGTHTAARRIHQDRARAEALGEMCRVVASERAADERQRIRVRVRLALDPGDDVGHRRGGPMRKVRDVQPRSPLRGQLRHELAEPRGLDARRRRTETVQVDDLGQRGPAPSHSERHHTRSPRARGESGISPSMLGTARAAFACREGATCKGGPGRGGPHTADAPHPNPLPANGRGQLSESRRAAFVNAAEAAVAHHQNVVAGLRLGRDRRDQRRHVVLHQHLAPRGASALARPSPGRLRSRTAVGRREAPGSASFIAPSFIVFERGSSTARMRAVPTWRRSPSTSSRSPSDDARDRRRRYPRTVPRFSAAFTPGKRASAASPWAMGTPTCRAAASAASAFNWL